MKNRFYAYAILLLIPSAGFSKATLSVSGISSGGFMAAQMAVIHSSQFHGVGTVAGGFYFCAKNHMQDKLKQAQDLKIYDLSLYQISPSNPTYQAVGICMKQPEKADVDVQIVEQNEVAQLIDPKKNILQQNVFLYQGAGDSVVLPAMQDQLHSFYRRLGVPEKQIKLVQTFGGHNFPTDRKEEKACFSQTVPYVAYCALDLAGEMLKHLTGEKKLIREVDAEKNRKNLYEVTQDLPGRLRSDRPDSLASYGYMAASQACIEKPEQCSVHVALHGCEMSDSFDHTFDKRYSESAKKGYLKMRTQEEMLSPLSPLPYIEQRQLRYGALRFALASGYLNYVEHNRLIVLFPQTWIGVGNYPLNPKGCWDWYGWTGRDYATKNGPEPRWLMQWIQQIRKSPNKFLNRDENGKPVPLHFQEAESL